MPGQLHVPDFVVFLDDDDRPPLRVIGVGVRVRAWVRLTLTLTRPPLLHLLGLELGSDADPTLPNPYPFT